MPINYPSKSLATQFISESFQDVLQVYGTLVLDGTGSVIFDSANISASISASYAASASFISGAYTAQWALSASYAPGNPSISASYAVTASYVSGANVPPNIAFTDVANIFTQNQIITGSVMIMSGSIVVGNSSSIGTTSDLGMPVIVTIGDGTDSGAYRSYFYQNTYDPRFCGGILVRKARGSALAPQTVHLGDSLAGFQASAYNGTSWSANVAVMRFEAADTFTTASTPTNILIQTTGRNQVLKRDSVVFGSEGNVLITNALSVPSSSVSGAILYSQDGNLIYLGSGSYGLSGSFISSVISASLFYGSGTNIIGVVSSSYATTASSADNFNVRGVLFVGQNATGSDQSALSVTFSAPASTGTGVPAGFVWRTGWQPTGSGLSQAQVSRLELAPSGVIFNPDLRPAGYALFETTRARPIVYGYGPTNEGSSLRFVQVGSAGGVIAYRAEGTPASLSLMAGNTTIANFGGGGWESSSWNVNARVNLRASTAENWSLTGLGTKWEVQTTQTGSTTTRTVATFNHDGAFILGSDPGGSQMLRVQSTAYVGGLTTFGTGATGSFTGVFNGNGAALTNIATSSFAATASYVTSNKDIELTVCRNQPGNTVFTVSSQLEEPDLSDRFRFDFSTYSQYRVTAGITGAGPSGSKVGVQYSTDQISWNYLDALSGSLISLMSTGSQVTNWSNLDVSARADVFIRWVDVNGDDLSAASFRYISIGVR